MILHAGRGCLVSESAASFRQSPPAMSRCNQHQIRAWTVQSASHNQTIRQTDRQTDRQSDWQAGSKQGSCPQPSTFFCPSWHAALGQPAFDAACQRDQARPYHAASCSSPHHRYPARRCTLERLSRGLEAPRASLAFRAARLVRYCFACITRSGALSAWSTAVQLPTHVACSAHARAVQLQLQRQAQQPHPGAHSRQHKFYISSAVCAVPGAIPRPRILA